MSELNDTTCRSCRERGKTWEGSDPRCAFTGGQFSGDNWNCATASKIREICAEYDRADLPHGVYRTWHEDENYATILIADCPRPDGAPFGAILFVQWYKSRGCTEEMLLLGYAEPRRPTEAECLAVIEHYQDRSLWPNGHPVDEDAEVLVTA